MKILSQTLTVAIATTLFIACGPKKTEEATGLTASEKAIYEQIANDTIKTKDVKVNNNEDNHKPLYKDVRVLLEASEIPCFDVGIAESGCLWIYTSDNGQNRDGLAQTIGYTAKKYGISCVTVFSPQQKTLGRANL